MSRRFVLIGASLLLAVVGFLLFRPDTYFTDISADESLEDAFTDTTTPDTTSATVPTTTPAATTPDPAATAQQIAVVSSGELYGIDHGASGTATIYERDGRFVLRFEDDANIQNGPDLYVWVLPSAQYDGGSPDDYIDLGKLKATVGGQNYELPSTYDSGTHRTVLIWCLRFAVPFAAVSLSTS